MKKKYQVFVSSTYEDLVEERMAVIHTLLDCGCIPVGMEQFPASSMSQMDYIKKMLDDCDYYILILAGRYGSLDNDGIGFTEKEYDYAESIGLPTMGFVIENINTLALDKSETELVKKQLLEEFRERVCSNRLVNFYSNIDELQKKVAVSLMQCIQDFPAIGWTRGSGVIDAETIELQIEDYLNKKTISLEQIDEVVPKYTNEALKGRFSFDYSNNDGKFVIGHGEYRFETKWSKASDHSIYAYSDSKNIEAIARIKGPVNINSVFGGDYDFSSRSRCLQLGDAVLWKNKFGKCAVTIVNEIKDDTRGADYDELCCEYTILN